MLFRSNEFDSNGKPLCEDSLYDKSQKIHYRIGGRDDVLSLNIKISLTSKNGYADEKLLKITLTDDKNPLFLYITEIDSEIYSKLRQKLGLLIDFAQFPNQLITLLTQCDSNDGAKYTIALEEVSVDPYDIIDGKCVLFKIMEINRFQRLCLVALHVVPGSDIEVNALMARNVLMLKRQIEILDLKCKETEERYLTAEQNIKTKHFEIEQTKAQAKEQIRFHKQKVDDEMATLKHNCEIIQQDCDRRIQKALHDQEEKHRATVASLETTVEKYRSEAHVIKNINHKLESDLNERNERLEKFHSDVKILQDEILKSESKISRLESETKEKNLFIVNLKQRYSHLEKERDDKDKAIKKLNSLLEASESSKNYLKSALKDKFQGFQKKEHDFATISKDLLKANEIIAKMNKEMGTTRQKLTERMTQVIDQQKIIDELKLKVTQIEQSIEQKDEKIKELDQECTKLKNQLKDAQECVKVKEELVRKNERIIGWLNDIVSKQDASHASRPQSSSSKCSALSSLTESISSKTLSTRPPLGSGESKAANTKKASIKAKPDFKTY